MEQSNDSPGTSSSASSAVVIELTEHTRDGEQVTSNRSAQMPGSIGGSPSDVDDTFDDDEQGYSTLPPDFHKYVPYLRDNSRTKYEEAALYVQEGINNNKFDSHPNGPYSKIAFKIVNNPIFYVTELVVCCLLMALAIIEEPAWLVLSMNQSHTIVVHTVLEMTLLSVIAFTILLRFIWMKPKTIFKQRTSLDAIIMIVMFIEAMVVLMRRENHFRVTRCLRPIFFIDSYLMAGVRRVLRYMYQSGKPICDVLLLLLLMVAIFALGGYYLFADVDPTYFDTYFKSFISLFITLTTANHPDIFMEAYVRNRAAPLFFILYLFVTLFFFTNVLLAVVYSRFSDLDRKKFKKLYLHKREALKLAFFVLAENHKGVNFRDFMLFMLEYKPQTPEYKIMCIFKALQSSDDPQEFLCLKDFYNFYEKEGLQWKRINEKGVQFAWYERFPSRIKTTFKIIHYIERFKYFDYIMTLIVLLNASFLIIYTIFISYYCGIDVAGETDEHYLRSRLLQYCSTDRFKASKNIIIGSFIFTGIYMIEIAIKILAVGPLEYFKKKWNIFDFSVITLSLIFLCIEVTSADSYYNLNYLVIFRPVKLLRIVKLKKSYYRIVSTMSFLADSLRSTLLLLMVIFYFYAIIGMEVFRETVHVGCCQDALYNVGQYYQNNATEYGVNSYWMNNFDNIYQSYVILYEEMVVNNWFIQMEGLVSETTIYSRLYFLLFWLTTTICLSVAISYIVDAFTFSIQAISTRNPTANCENHVWFKCDCNPSSRKRRVFITLLQEEIRTLKNVVQNINEYYKTDSYINRWIRKFRRISFDKMSTEQVRFIGKSLKTKENINLEKFGPHLKEWIKEDKQEKKEKKKQNMERQNDEAETKMSVCHKLIKRTLIAALKNIIEIVLG